METRNCVRHLVESGIFKKNMVETGVKKKNMVETGVKKKTKKGVSCFEGKTRIVHIPHSCTIKFDRTVCLILCFSTKTKYKTDRRVELYSGKNPAQECCKGHLD